MSSHQSPIKEIEWIGSTVIARVSGDIDLNRSPQFQHGLLELLDRKPRRIVVNLAEVRYMDSSGIASLVKLLSRTRKAGLNLRLAALNDQPRKAFEITLLDTAFEIFSTEKEALA
ncbi:MAG: Anti-sigma-B factor antagonist [Planctomycetes bacterium ADurb.Bin126]|nr:MAG: Anti-sigma-B factor antagonist [Planctomycetes bacterium ADurb.Bin126]HOD83874.1 STAS domain-containing protein [Phycisphaerae bacterium]HQL76361.1 STAS domain-containing protein [Phycisphaerae bacterium]